MTKPPSPAEKIVLALVVILALTALGFVLLAPGFSLDNTLVYGGF